MRRIHWWVVDSPGKEGTNYTESVFRSWCYHASNRSICYVVYMLDLSTTRQFFQELLTKYDKTIFPRAPHNICSKEWLGAYSTMERSISHHIFLLGTSIGRLDTVRPWVSASFMWHDDVIKWKHFPRYWPFVRGLHRSSVNSPHKGQWRGALMFSLICAWISDWVNNREAGDLRRHRTHYDVNVMNKDGNSMQPCLL